MSARTPFGRGRWLRIAVLQTDGANSLEPLKTATCPLRALQSRLTRFRGFRLYWACKRQTRVSARARGLSGALMAVAGRSLAKRPQNSKNTRHLTCRQPTPATEIPNHD